MTEQTQEQTEPVEAPEVAAVDPTPEETTVEPKPKPARRRTKRERDAAKARRSEAYDVGLQSMEMTFDEWSQKWDWNQPRMYSTLKREIPAQHLGHPTGGRLEGKPNAFYTEDEIQQRFGGGTYVVFVSGIDPKNGKFRALGSKRVTIAGDPRTDVKPQSAAAQGTPAPAAQGGNSDVADLAPQAQAGLVGLLGEQMKHTRESAHASAPSADPEVMHQMDKVYASQVDNIKEAAQQRESLLMQQMNEVRQELTAVRAERDGLANKIEVEVAGARQEGSQYINQLIPTFAAQADQRAADAMRQAHDQVARMQEQFARDLQMHQAHFTQQIENQKMAFATAEANAQTLFQGQIQHLQTLNAAQQAKIDTLESTCQTLRDNILMMHQEQAKKQDPLVRIQETMQLKDFVSDLAGGGEGEGTGNPMLDLAAKFAPALGGAMDIAKARMGIAEQPQQGMPPQQLPPHMQQQMQQPMPPPQVPMPQAPGVPQPAPVAPPTQAMVPAGPQAPAAQQTGKRVMRRRQAPVQVKRQDLEVGISMLNMAVQTATPPDKAADTAATQIDRGTLKALVMQPPEAVINSLMQAGLLDGPIASEGGLQYLHAFLIALKTRLNPPVSEPEPEAAAPAPEPEAAEPSDDGEA